MANFPTHITTSAVLGTAYGTVAHINYGVPLPSCLLAGGLCTIAGVLPDVDSDNAVILREILAFVAAVVPMLMLDRFRELGWPQETIVVASGLIYVIIRFGGGELIRRMTIHRGMWHSIPAALIASGIVYFLCACPESQVRMFKTAAVFIGFSWHLILDEIYSVEFGRRVKRSFGTAFKFFGPSPIGNLMAYGMLAGLAFVLFGKQPNLHQGDPIAQPVGDSSVVPGQLAPVQPGYSQPQPVFPSANSSDVDQPAYWPDQEGSGTRGYGTPNPPGSYLPPPPSQMTPLPSGNPPFDPYSPTGAGS